MKEQDKRLQLVKINEEIKKNNKRHQYERTQKPKANHHSNSIQKPWGLRTLRSRMARIQKQHMNPKEKGGGRRILKKTFKNKNPVHDT